MELRNALRMLRSEVGLTQIEFASAVFVSFSTVNRWENKGMRPNRMQSKAILELAKQHRVSSACLEMLTNCLLASRMDDKEDRARMREEDEQIKQEQRSLLTAEQFRKTMDNIDIALIGQRFYNGDPESCDVFYHNNVFAKSFGFSPREFDELLRKDPYFAIAKEQRRTMDQYLKALLAHKIEPRDFSLITKAVRKDGTTFWLEVKAASLTEYSYGQEVFTFCRDVTRRVEAEQRYKEEVLLRDVSMQIMFSYIHFNLTEDRILRHHNLKASLGRSYGGESFDQLIQLAADAAPDDAEKRRFLETFSREGLLSAYDKGQTYGSIVLYNRNVRHWFRNEYILVKNSANGCISALIYIFDVQRQVLSESMLGIFLKQFFDFVGLLDISTETVEPYFYAEGVFHEEYLGQLRHYPTACEEKLRQYGLGETAAQESLAIDLNTVRARLNTERFYTVVLHLKGYNGERLQKKITYTYLDDNRNTIIIAQSDIDRLTQFLQSHTARYGLSDADLTGTKANTQKGG